MILRFLAVSALLALATPAKAGVSSDLAKIDARLDACIDKDQRNAGMKACTGEALDAADKVLNRVYKSRVEKLKQAPSGGSADDDKEILKRLVASERVWVAYKGAECDLQGIEMLGGTGEGLVVGQCLYAMTKARAKRLDELFGEK